MKNTEKLYLVKQAGYWSELFGGAANTMAAGTLGGGIGGALGGRRGAMAGANAGIYLPLLAAAITAGATPTRSREEQINAEGEGFMNLLPGRATYNGLKRLGHSLRGEGSPGLENERREMEERLDPKGALEKRLAEMAAKA